MTTDEAPDPEIRFSPLSRTVAVNGVAVRVDIYEDLNGGWLLEVIDGENTSPVWDDSFETDSAALDEALRALREESVEFWTPGSGTDRPN